MSTQKPLFPTVDRETFLFPEPTMDALREALGSADPDAIAAAVEAWLTENPIEGVTQEEVNASIATAIGSGGRVHLGAGAPPDFISGARVKDIYIDMTNGTIYQLEEG